MSKMLTVKAKYWDKGVQTRLQAALDTGLLLHAEGPRPGFGAPPFRFWNEKSWDILTVSWFMNMNTFTNLED